MFQIRVIVVYEGYQQILIFDELKKKR